MKLFQTFFMFFFLLLGVNLGGCGYGLQTSHNPLFLREGVRRVYVPPLVNNTYKAGVENVVYRNLIRTLVGSGKLVLVHSPEDSDAILQGTVQTALFGGSAASVATVAGLNPLGLGATLPAKDFQISTEYMASLTCSFSLVRRNPPRGKAAQLWGSSFSREKPFPAANQLGVLGATSSLINESEFDRTLNDLARSMMDDVQESMLSLF